MDLNPMSPRIWKEIHAHMATAGAQHIIQQVLIHPEHKPGMPLPIRASAQGRRYDEEEIRRELDNAMNILFIEFMGRGRFDDYIASAAQQKERFPSQVLWQIFDCLFRGVCGMAYPEAFRNRGLDFFKDDIPQTRETSINMPDCRFYPGSWEASIVHYDIDTVNVLIGDFDKTEHNIVPLIKIADLGLATPFYLGIPWDKMWARRKVGKSSIYPPEATSHEWDYHEIHPSWLRCMTGGNYGYWTNLYQIALIMWQLITLCRLEMPPQPVPWTVEREDGTLQAVWTYGERVLDAAYNDIDVELRELVAMCMCDNPEHRPTLEVIEGYLDKFAKTSGPEDPEEQAAQDWARRIFGGPPPPQPSMSMAGLAFI
ncbi:hypothetical protein B0T16DRAFT_410523 [Cercophora newfieldiana]|uniref:Protein kinase domain-containing protein n=1 Tax=Cercophora newfieldiana TaxID=92897 RepID=A0AA39YD28_9PEZI|nr:hypothetical protein B0T16DRAFT_410523 [Cercophora newfieldiana]